MILRRSSSAQIGPRALRCSTHRSRILTILVYQVPVVRLERLVITFYKYNTSHQVIAFLALQSMPAEYSDHGPVRTCTPTRHSGCGMTLAWQRLMEFGTPVQTIFFVRTVGSVLLLMVPA